MSKFTENLFAIVEALGPDADPGIVIDMARVNWSSPDERDTFLETLRGPQ